MLAKMFARILKTTMLKTTTIASVLALGLMGLIAIGTPRAAHADESAITIFAAASLKDALNEAAQAYMRTGGAKVTISFAASSQLARQIEQGAPADMFISADAQWMDVLAKANVLQNTSRIDLLGNSLVLVMQAPPQPSFEKITPPAIKQRMIKGTLALAEVTSVPAGRYAKAALQSTGEWEQMKPRIVMTDNVRAALTLVARGETDFGIVYATDAKVEPKIHVVKTYPAESHPPIVYPMALTTKAGKAAQGFHDFLLSAPARVIFEKYGFVFRPANARAAPAAPAPNPPAPAQGAPADAAKQNAPAKP